MQKLQYTLATENDTAGSCLQGYISCSISELIRHFGEPVRVVSEDKKAICNWALKFSDETVATVYAWKTGSVPSGNFEWSVGGRSPQAVKNVASVLGVKPKWKGDKDKVDG